MEKELEILKNSIENYSETMNNLASHCKSVDADTVNLFDEFSRQTFYVFTCLQEAIEKLSSK